ncbi:nucleoside-diphosphate sugar epimerase/dehydratase [Pseudooceanicola onchidii]|uniref:nucleoside-diphosphate sugar epimerase/dehydratase n=1 Tax=Pseudooceanicola onchidii TaxID=2562279 RepID=UPI0010AB2342|nr:nucleoside-diphosphate sugar epimerase/dehydratase [Pseudooceanicola onchidii]
MDVFTADLSKLSRTTKVAIQAVADILLVIVCYLTAMALRLDALAFVARDGIWGPLAVVLPVTLFVFLRLGLYRAVVRYISTRALRTVLFGVVLSAVALAISARAMDAPVPRSVPIIYAVLLFLSVSGVRFLIRSLFRRTYYGARAPVIVYGAGEAGRQLVNAMDLVKPYRPVAFVDDDVTLHQNTIGGLRVYSPDRLAGLIDQTGATTLLLALPSVDRARLREIVRGLTRYKIDIKTIPGVEDIVRGTATLADVRNVSPEDLLGRDPVAPMDDLMRRNITGKTILVSGAGGSIGSELCRQILHMNPSEMILLDISEFALYQIEAELRETAKRTGRDTIRISAVLGSVQNRERTRAIMRTFKVQTVYHAAAYKHVPMVEENVVEGIRNNVFGTKTIAEAAVEAGVEHFILISTDKAVRPTNVMGASKRMAELVCQALAMEQSDTIFSMVRFGNVLGSSGSVIPRFQQQIDHGGPITVTHRKINRYFMTIPEAAQLVIQAGAMGVGGDVFVLDMGEPMEILELAHSMARLHGLASYVIDHEDEIDPERGDMPILITGLRKGEKLFEELLIGDNASGTSHPRIMTASEVALDYSKLSVLLDQLWEASLAFDANKVIAIFRKAPLGYAPSSDEIADLMWNMRNRAGPQDGVSQLRVVSSVD